MSGQKAGRNLMGKGFCSYKFEFASIRGVLSEQHTCCRRPERRSGAKKACQVGMPSAFGKAGGSENAGN